MNYYNEIDPLKAEVIREAIKAGAISEGDVDERSIVDVRGSDLRGYTQCHFFAGGGFWSLALRYAGWPDDKPCWTGSCPCPSFSAAGKGRGFDDPRHLWPEWFRLIGECKPPVLFGEQVGAAIAHGWLDLVSTDLEAEGYAVAAAVFGACSVGAPHRRQRLYFCADTELGRSQQFADSCGEGTSVFDEEAPQGERLQPTRGRGTGSLAGNGSHPDGRQSSNGDVQRSGELGLFAQDRGTGVLPHSDLSGRQPIEDVAGRSVARDSAQRRQCIEPRESSLALDGSHPTQRGLPMRGSAPRDSGHPAQPGESGVDLDALSPRLEGHFGDVRDWRGPGWLDPREARSVAEAGATRGFWADCDWWYGRDGKYRPIGPGLQPLAHGSPARVGRLRMYGDGIVVTQAQEFIEAYCEARG